MNIMFVMKHINFHCLLGDTSQNHQNQSVFKQVNVHFSTTAKYKIHFTF